MTQPNAACEAFCFWLLNISKQKLSGPQRVIVTQVFNAATGQYPVTNQTWWNFNLFTAWRNPFYLVYKSYAQEIFPDLLSGLIYSYSFEGNSNSVFGSNNGTDTSMVYGLPYGVIDQGAYFVGPLSQILLSTFSSTQNFTVSVWVTPDNAGVGYSSILADSTSNTGLYINNSTQQFTLFFSSDHLATPVITYGLRYNVTWVCTAGVSSLYVNNVLALSGVVIGPSFLWRYVGNDAGSEFYKGAMDILSFWDRPLTSIEIGEYYNLANGTQYPF